jgi:predicted alpha/beta superfamily hydrolase
MTMKKIIAFSFFIIFLNFLRAQNVQQTPFGRVERIENFKSKYTESRNIDIWLPAHYDGKKRFVVLYMHDGQMLFDPQQTWNKQAWDVDDIATAMMQKGEIQDLIVVGIWNAGQGRHANFFPQQPYENLRAIDRDTINAQLKRIGRTKQDFQPNADNYLKFLVEELKPHIDKIYRVKKDKKHTFIAGSSMGGLISMYAIAEYPKVFGAAACLSTHWVGTFSNENNPIPDAFLQYLDKKLPKLKKNKLYFDCGDQTLDALYPPIQNKVDALMRKHQFDKKHWKTEFFKGKDHSEKAWKERFHVPLLFLAA